MNRNTRTGDTGTTTVAPSGTVQTMTPKRRRPAKTPRVRWYTCVTDRVAEVPHLFERHVWHLIFSPDPMSIKLGLAWYAKPEHASAYLHRRRVATLVCMLRRIEAGGRKGGRAERRLHRWPYRVSEAEVADARLLVDREIAIGNNFLAQSPREFEGSAFYLMPAFVFAMMFAQACAIDQGAAAAVTAVVTAIFFVMNALAWGWRQGYREAMWQSLVAEKADRATEEQARLDAMAPCDLDVKAAGARQGEGYLYVILFSTGAIKIGQSRVPRRRLGEHRRDAAVFGVNITRYWISRPHVGFLRTEAALIDACLQAKGRQFRREYFSDIAFDIAVGLAFQVVAPQPAATAGRAAR